MTTALCFYRKLNIEQRAGAWRIPALPSHQCRLHRQPTAPVAAAELRGAWTWPSRGDKVSRRPSSRQLGAKAWTEQSSACQQQDERAGLLCGWLSLRAQSGARRGQGPPPASATLQGISAAPEADAPQGRTCCRSSRCQPPCRPGLPVFTMLRDLEAKQTSRGSFPS